MVYVGSVLLSLSLYLSLTLSKPGVSFGESVSVLGLCNIQKSRKLLIKDTEMTCKKMGGKGELAACFLIMVIHDEKAVFVGGLSLFQQNSFLQLINFDLSYND